MMPNQSNNVPGSLGAHEGMKPSGQAHTFDLDALAVWLAGNIPGFGGPIVVEPFEGGQSNPTYKLNTPDGALVIRTKPGPSSRLLPSAHAIEREFLVLKALASTEVPVAKVYALCTDESVIGRMFYIMEYVEGRIIWNQALPEMTPRERSAVYDEMNRVIALLHRVDVEACGLSDFGRPGNYFERQIKRWSAQYCASEMKEIPEMHALMDWLPNHLPASSESRGSSTIVHGDYRLDNLVFHPAKPKVQAVLDWELSTLGHPLADFSYHCMGWHIAPGAFRGIGGLDYAALGIPNEKEYIARYCRRTGIITPAELEEDWNFYIAYNLFRLAAILQGIAKRVAMGIASSDKAAASAAAARPLAELAWAKAQLH